MKNYRIIFAGTPLVSTYFLESIFEKKYFEIIAVITQPDKKQKRSQKLISSPVKIKAEQYHLSVFTPSSLKNEVFIKKIRDLKPDLILIASYAKLFPLEIIKIPRYQTICFHPSLLPKYQGTTPIQSVILNNEKETGFTFFLINEKFDQGPIIYQKKFSISTEENNLTLTEKLFQMGSQQVNEIIKKYLNGKLKAIPQNKLQTTYTRKLRKEDGFFTPEENLQSIWCKFRAYLPWPGIWTIWKNKRIKIIDLKLENNKIQVKKIQLEGKRPVTLNEFKNGHPDFDLF